MTISKVTVIGAGTMGNGIAQVMAQNGYMTHLCDVSTEALDKALKTIEKNLLRMAQKGIIVEDQIQPILNRIHKFTSLEEAVKGADIVIEAATENVNLKLKIFGELSKLVEESTILATNTSSISITQIASVVKAPNRVIGMHFMNPVPIMKLVEIIRGYSTSDDVYEQVKALSIDIDKTPVEVNDYPGFVANRILMPMINEAIYALFEGVAGVEEIDTVMRLGMAHPMGPLTLADFIGLDVCKSILDIMHEGHGNPKYAPCPLLNNMVMAGKLGRKTGEGFYTYSADGKTAIVSPYFVSKG